MDSRIRAYKLAKEYAEYAKSDAPKFTPSKTKANELIGCVASTNWCINSIIS